MKQTQSSLTGMLQSIRDNAFLQSKAQMDKEDKLLMVIEVLKKDFDALNDRLDFLEQRIQTLERGYKDCKESLEITVNNIDRLLEVRI